MSLVCVCYFLECFGNNQTFRDVKVPHNFSKWPKMDDNNDSCL